MRKLKMREGMDERKRWEMKRREEEEVRLDKKIGINKSVIWKEECLRWDKSKKGKNKIKKIEVLKDGLGIGKLGEIVDEDEIIERKLDGSEVKKIEVRDWKNISEVILEIRIVIEKGIEKRKRVL